MRLNKLTKVKTGNTLSDLKDILKQWSQLVWSLDAYLDILHLGGCFYNYLTRYDSNDIYK